MPLTKINEIEKVNVGTNALSYDAWGRNKAISDDSIFHGMFTYNVPVTSWYETINGVIGPTTNCTSVDGALQVTAGATFNDYTYLRSYRNPRYEPNRGALYSTSSVRRFPTSQTCECVIGRWGGLRLFRLAGYLR